MGKKEIMGRTASGDITRCEKKTKLGEQAECRLHNAHWQKGKHLKALSNRGMNLEFDLIEENAENLDLIADSHIELDYYMEITSEDSEKKAAEVRKAQAEAALAARQANMSKSSPDAARAALAARNARFREQELENALNTNSINEIEGQLRGIDREILSEPQNQDLKNNRTILKRALSVLRNRQR